MVKCINNYLENNKSQTVILCDYGISPRQMKSLLTTDVILYDAGIDMFDVARYTPHHYSEDSDLTVQQTEELKNWIHHKLYLI